MSTHHPRHYGRRAPKRAPALHLGHFLTGVVPAHPAAADYLARLKGGWQMLGNDIAGDCVSVTWANFRRLMTALVAGREVYPTQDQVWAIYKTQNPGFDPNGTETNGPGSRHDGGMDIQTLCEYLVKHGGPDGVKALGFAQVNAHNTEEVKAAIAIFGGVWVGITVQEINQQQFADGQPWDYSRTSPDEGGHSVLGGGYGAGGAGPLGGDEKFITWAEETSFTDAFWTHKTGEVWVVIWPEHLKDNAFLAGVDMHAFAAAYTAITGGKPFPAVIPPAPQPTPQPAPTPTPTPGPDDADRALAAALRARRKDEDTWLAAKNL
jgi:hypothetical protein